MGADHTAAGELLAVAADDYRQRRKDGEFSVEHEVSRLRRRVAFLEGQLEKADRLAKTVDGLLNGVRFGARTELEELEKALSDYRAAREGGNQ